MHEDEQLKPADEGPDLQRTVMAPTSGLDVWKRRGELAKARRDYMKQAMAEYDKTHHAQMAELRSICEALTGHAFAFSHVGPVGHVWHYCNHCGASKVDAP